METMERRIALQKLLEEILGSRYVYFEPPESIKLSYPCIIYGYTNLNVKYADDKKYLKKKAYDVTVISLDPEDEVSEKVSDLDYCFFDRRFTSDNLIHDVYRLYF